VQDVKPRDGCEDERGSWGRHSSDDKVGDGAGYSPRFSLAIDE
jgi:hypothetical protein